MSAFLKSGVGAARIVGLGVPMAIAWAIAVSIFRDESVDCVLTAGIDGSHSRGSIHYKGLAIDLRANHLTSDIQKRILQKLQVQLGDEFDVLLEGEGTVNVHFHIEFDPKTPINKET